MKLLIIGGTGGTGRQLIRQALELGHQVTALVRKPQKLKITQPNLHVIKGNVLDLEMVEQIVAGQEAVLSALGHKRFFIKTSILSRAQRTSLMQCKDRM